MILFYSLAPPANQLLRYYDCETTNQPFPAIAVKYVSRRSLQPMYNTVHGPVGTAGRVVGTHSDLLLAMYVFSLSPGRRSYVARLRSQKWALKGILATVWRYWRIDRGQARGWPSEYGAGPPG